MGQDEKKRLLACPVHHRTTKIVILENDPSRQIERTSKPLDRSDVYETKYISPFLLKLQAFEKNFFLINAPRCAARNSRLRGCRAWRIGERFSLAAGSALSSTHLLQCNGNMKKFKIRIYMTRFFEKILGPSPPVPTGHPLREKAPHIIRSPFPESRKDGSPLGKGRAWKADFVVRDSSTVARVLYTRATAQNDAG